MSANSDAVLLPSWFRIISKINTLTSKDTINITYKKGFPPRLIQKDKGFSKKETKKTIHEKTAHHVISTDGDDYLAAAVDIVTLL